MPLAAITPKTRARSLRCAMPNIIKIGPQTVDTLGESHFLPMISNAAMFSETYKAQKQLSIRIR
jgi:hypothetical protein